MFELICSKNFLFFLDSFVWSWSSVAVVVTIAVVVAVVALPRPVDELWQLLLPTANTLMPFEILFHNQPDDS